MILKFPAVRCACLPYVALIYLFLSSFFNRTCYTPWIRGVIPRVAREFSRRNSPRLSAGDSRRNRRGWKYALAMYRLSIMAVGALRALFQPLEGSSFVSPPLKSGILLSLPVPVAFSPPSARRRICELNSNGSLPFRSFQRAPMFSLRLMYSRKARVPLLPSRSLGICFSPPLPLPRV